MKRAAFLLVVWLSPLFLFGQSVPSDEAVRRILTERLGDRIDRIGIVVGIIEPAGRRIIAVGSFGKATGRAVDGDTLFEIGSVSKVFTSLLLADMVQQGKVSLADPVAKYLPAGVKMPERNGRAITLEDLARHRSALPRLPSNFDANTQPQNPYASYTVKQLYDFLSSYELPRDIGSEFEYSNLGAGLLGHVLALASGKDYETLVKDRICDPLGMKSTAITLPQDLRARMATGHDNSFEPTSNWDLPTLAGAGALRSSANDMLRFLAAQLGYVETGLKPTIALTVAQRTPSNPGMEIGLGWLMRPKKGSEIIWHNGGTGGYRAFAGYDPKARTGVVVLSNVYTPIGVDDMGFHLLDPESKIVPHDSPLVSPTKRHTEITLEPSVLELYVGKYQFTPEMHVTITRKEGQLFAQLTGQGPIEIYPESRTGFFGKVVDAQVEFKIDSEGKPTALVLRQMGRVQRANKLQGDGAIPQEWFGRREAKVDPALYDRYVGQYQLPEGPIFTVTREGDRLYSQLTGQPKIEIFPESERVFFVKILDGLITFETDEKGPAKALMILQNDRQLRATRVTGQ